jgi:hypothetical protein
MSSIRNSYPAMQIPVFSAPSTFGMPACGHVTDVNVKGDMGLETTIVAARTYPGTSAWSPPPS